MRKLITQSLQDQLVLLGDLRADTNTVVIDDVEVNVLRQLTLSLLRIAMHDRVGPAPQEVLRDRVAPHALQDRQRRHDQRLDAGKLRHDVVGCPQTSQRLHRVVIAESMRHIILVDRHLHVVVPVCPFI